MTVRLKSMDVVTTGFHYQIPEIMDEDNYVAWYNGNYDSLLPLPTLENGLRLVYDSTNQNYNRLNLPLFKLASDFIFNAVMNELPAYSAEPESAQNWLKENIPMIDRTLRDATRYWSILDRAVLAAEPGIIRQYNPREYFRVGEASNLDRLVGHIIALRFRDETIEDQKLATRTREPNAVQVIRFSEAEGINDTQIFHFDGGIIGNPITAREPSPLRAVCVVGMGDSWYGGIKDIVARILILESLILQETNRWFNRTEYQPIEYTTRVEQQYGSEPGKSYTPQELSVMLRNIVYPAVSLDMSGENGTAVPPSTWAEVLDLSDIKETLRGLKDMFFLSSGVTPSSFGIGVGRGESGIAREKAQDAAIARASAYRRDLQNCLPELCKAAGAPMRADINFNWVSPPFFDRSHRQQELLSLLGAGVIDAEEVRSALGWDKREETTVEPTSRQESVPERGA